MREVPYFVREHRRLRLTVPTLALDGDGEMAMLTVVGGFFDADGPVTYTANFDYEDQPITITAP